MKSGKYVVPAPRSGDQIVYLCGTKAGGIDGRDLTDKGGVVVFATFDKDQAISYSQNGNYSMEPTVVEVESAITNALKKLSAIDKLVLGFLPEHRVNR